MGELMARFDEGDRVRVDIPDETDPDHDSYHGTHGRISDVFTDDAETVTGDPQDSLLYRVALDTDEQVDLRHRDLRPPLNE